MEGFDLADYFIVSKNANKDAKNDDISVTVKKSVKLNVRDVGKF